MRLEKALFVSPVLDMEALIGDMMAWAGVDEDQLKARGEVPTAFGETLSWRYLQYVRAHRVRAWPTPTALLRAQGDALVREETVREFLRRFGGTLTVEPEGEHWFHTPEQLAALRRWEAAHAALDCTSEAGGDTMIVYFSGTGNSRFCALRLAQALGDEALDAFPLLRVGEPAALSSERPWVFAAPTYGWQLPPPVPGLAPLRPPGGQPGCLVRPDLRQRHRRRGGRPPGPLPGEGAPLPGRSGGGHAGELYRPLPGPGGG